MQGVLMQRKLLFEFHKLCTRLWVLARGRVEGRWDLSGFACTCLRARRLARGNSRACVR